MTGGETWKSILYFSLSRKQYKIALPQRANQNNLKMKINEMITDKITYRNGRKILQFQRKEEMKWRF